MEASNLLSKETHLNWWRLNQMRDWIHSILNPNSLILLPKRVLWNLNSHFLLIEERMKTKKKLVSKSIRGEEGTDKWRIWTIIPCETASTVLQKWLVHPTKSFSIQRRGWIHRTRTLILSIMTRTQKTERAARDLEKALRELNASKLMQPNPRTLWKLSRIRLTRLPIKLFKSRTWV